MLEDFAVFYVINSNIQRPTSSSRQQIVWQVHYLRTSLALGTPSWELEMMRRSIQQRSTVSGNGN